MTLTEAQSDQDTVDLPALQQLPMPLTYFRITLRELGTTPDRRADLLAGTGVTVAQLADPAAEIALGQQLQQMRNAARIGAPGWSLDVGRRFDLGAQGPLGFAMISAATLGASFDVMANYGHVRSPWFRLNVERDPHHWGIVIQRQIRLGIAVDTALVEALLLSAQALVEAVLGRPMHEAQITCDYAAPAWAPRYADVFNANVSFGAERLTIQMPVEWRALSCPLADAALYQLALGRLETERRRLESGDHLEARVEVLLAAAGDGGLTLPKLAERLNLSRRTLIRRLSDAGTTFGKLLDRHQMRRAATLLADPEYSAAEVAYRLGYSDPANFARAFRRWFGETPGRYRTRQARKHA
jgi:AraC-like DNA-binding protein